MERRIVSFFQDEEEHWVARLSCHHPQHVRHDPPLISRPWTKTQAGRQSRIGEPLFCKRCEEAQWPEGLEPYKSTRHFTAQDTPAALRADHATREGVWAKLYVLQGEVLYVVGERTQVITPDTEPGVIVSAQPHHVTPSEGAVFFVQFYRLQQA